jgi:hypothetical protein
MNPARMFLESLDRRPGIREQPGSQPDLPPFDRDVRFAALNGPKSDIVPCPKRAKSGIIKEQKRPPRGGLSENSLVVDTLKLARSAAPTLSRSAASIPQV